jgi:hypothetical protein
MSFNVRDLLEAHISLELESINRLYLNGYMPQLQHGAGLVGFLCQQRGRPIAWLKRQLTKEGIAFESLDNGFLRCQNPERLQALANALGP